MGTLKAPCDRCRMRAASETSWSKAGWMKSANWISATGRRPCRDIPMATPTMPDSASGVSMTRISPNSSRNPAVARNTPPLAPTSSPRTTTRSSDFISSHNVSCTVWTMFFSGIGSGLRAALRDRGLRGGGLPAGGLHGIGHPQLRSGAVREELEHGGVRFGIRGVPGVLHLPVDLALELDADRFDGLVVEETEGFQVLAEQQDGVVALRFLGLLAA